MKPEAYEIMAQTEDEHWWFAGRRKILAATIAGLGLPTEASILEIGSGTGGNLAMLGGFGEVSAVELDDFARRKGIEKTGLPIQKGYLPDGLPFAGPAFDLICLFDVLEHVKTDGPALKALLPLLKPGGRVLLTVPAYQWMWSSHDVKLHHFRRYTRETLSTCCGSAGFEIQRITYFNTLLFPLALAVRLLDRLKPGDDGASGEAIPPAPLNRLFRILFASESGILRHGNIPFGLSLLAVLNAPRGQA
jgi:SAM-dependent methyltransferase